MRWLDLAGYVASSFVFLTFYMKGMVPLRVAALCSNVAFLIYAGFLHLAPIFILHASLIPINLLRLLGALRERRARWESPASGGVMDPSFPAAKRKKDPSPNAVESL